MVKVVKCRLPRYVVDPSRLMDAILQSNELTCWVKFDWDYIPSPSPIYCTYLPRYAEFHLVLHSVWKGTSTWSKESVSLKLGMAHEGFLVNPITEFPLGTELARRLRLYCTHHLRPAQVTRIVRGWGKSALRGSSLGSWSSFRSEGTTLLSPRSSSWSFSRVSLPF